MKVQITKLVGKSTLTFEVEGEKEIDAVSKAAAFATMPDQCGMCKSKNVALDSNKAESFIFVKIKCLDCKARSQMGQFKDGSGVFFKKWEIYVPTDETAPKEDAK